MKINKHSHIAIIGGGIGGLSTAVALRQQEFTNVQIYEAAPEIKPVGKGIWLPTNAMLAMDQLGLGTQLAQKGIPLESIEVHDKTAGALQTIDLKRVQTRFGRTTTSILRADLQTTLVAALPRETIHVDKRCLSVSQNGHTATATFADGTTRTADLLIGADGLRSAVREAVVPDVPLRYSGQSCYLGIAHITLPPNLRHTVREIWGGRYRFGYSAVGENKVYWFAPHLAPADEPLPTNVLPILHELYADFPAPVQEIIAHTPAAEIIRVDLRDFAPIKQWRSGRIWLIGDAAHAMTPNLGQGGGQAIEDAYVLAQVLAQNSSLDEAYRQFLGRRQAKATRIANTAWRLGQIAHLTGPVTRTLRNIAFKWTPEALKQQQVEALYTLS